MNLRKVILCVTVLSAVVCFMILFITYVFPFQFVFKLWYDLPDASAIGIIGAADGPTSIHISRSSNRYWAIIPFLVTIVGSIYLMISRKSRKKSENKYR